MDNLTGPVLAGMGEHEDFMLTNSARLMRFPRARKFTCRTLVVALAALAAACGGDGVTEPEPPPPAPNRAPVASGTIPAQSVNVGESVTVNVTSAFSDPDGDALTFSATSSTPGVVAVAVSGANMTVTGVSAGTAAITVTATDPERLSASLNVTVTVTQPNRAPTVAGSIPSQTLSVGDTASVDAALYFSDPDGDALTFSATSAAEDVASVVVTDTNVSIAGVSAGTADITVTATDPGGLSASLGVDVSVVFPDRSVLELLYEATGGENWTRDDNWLTDAPLSEWYRVTVNDRGRVVRLHLDFNDLTGSIPSALGQLSELEYLSLSGNDLTGPIPPELAGLSKLEDLWLSFNDLTGPIPAEMGQLSALELLAARGNDLAGPLPSELDQLSQVGALLITGNRLTDPFPASFTSLGEVWWLEWQGNAGLCAPNTAAFDAWLAGIESQLLGSWSGPRCGAAYGNHRQYPAGSSVEIRHLEDRMAVEMYKGSRARDQGEAMEIQEAIRELHSQIEELRSGPHSRRDGGSR